MQGKIAVSCITESHSLPQWYFYQLLDKQLEIHADCTQNHHDNSQYKYSLLHNMLPTLTKQTFTKHLLKMVKLYVLIFSPTVNMLGAHTHTLPTKDSQMNAAVCPHSPVNMIWLRANCNRSFFLNFLWLCRFSSTSYTKLAKIRPLEWI